MNQTEPSSELDFKKAQRAAYLIVGYNRSTLTDQERDELDDWVGASESNMRLFAELTDKSNLEKELRLRESFNSEEAIQRVMDKLSIAPQSGTKSKRKPMIGYSIAAVLLLLIGIFLITRYFSNSKLPQPAIAQKSDLPPGSNKATLTTAGGVQLELDNNSPSLGQVKGVASNIDGRLTYSKDGNTRELHTLTTPKGGQYQLLLPDGSHVWLNAASSITFPAAFLEKERVVEITGEAYFEISKDQQKKFIVIANGLRTEVLGTQFNINSYTDEGAPAVTLIEGSIRVTDFNAIDTTAITLTPGQQLIADTKGREIVQPDLPSVLAWKNGHFEFKKATIESIMRQVSRWYNVDVVYEGKVDYHFMASVERKEPISKLLALLEMTDKVHFTIKDKTIIVKP